MKFEIKHRHSDRVLFTLEADSLKSCVEAAIKRGVELQGANFQGMELQGANFQGAELQGANFQGAKLQGTNFQSAKLQGTNFQGAELWSMNFQGAELQGTNFRGAELQDTNFQGADLWGADFQNAKLQSTNFRNAKLWSTKFQGAKLWGAEFQGAELWSANFRGVELWSTNFRGVELWGVNLQGADLQGAEGINKNRCTPLTMLLDQPGKIRAYKLVNENQEGPHKGGIIYEIGESYRVNDANTDDMKNCGAGINVATLDWCMKGWRKGYRILIVEFEAADIATIPVATDGKFRLHQCKVVGEKDLKEIGLIHEEAKDEQT